jgi:hypothetical protein
MKGGMKEPEQPHIFCALAKATVCLLELHLMEPSDHRTALLGKVLRFKLPEANHRVDAQQAIKQTRCKDQSVSSPSIYA